MSLTSERLRMLREKAGRSQGEVARLIGISRPAYVSYETGRSKPSRKIRELANLYNVSTDYLLGLTDNPIIPLLQTDESTPFGRAVAKAKQSYYHDEETARLAQELKENPDLRVLLDASRGLKKESLEEIKRFILYQKARENGL